MAERTRRGPVAAWWRRRRDPSGRATRNREARQFWARLPGLSFVILLGAVACLFSTFGFLVDVRLLGRQSGAELTVTVALSAVVAILYAWVALRRPKWLPAAVAFHLALTFVVRRAFPDVAAAPDPAALERRLEIDAAGSIVGIVFGYVLFIMFVAREGGRYFRAHEEIRLAREIHGLLVPTVAQRVGTDEFYGLSYPSGEVGGDLVDVVASPGGGWLAYVADVSGHGVQAGVLMGLVKSAARMRLAGATTLTGLLDALNVVLPPLKQPQMFVTVAALQRTGGGLRAALAGHLPILRVPAGGGPVEEIHVPQIPLGVLDGHRFTDTSVEAGPGDLFLVLTDGLTEVFDDRDEELGLDGVKRVLAEGAEAPLPNLAERLVSAARAHGTQLDDQTLLLLRLHA